MEIRETEWGIANNFGDYIEINKHLKTEEPKLYWQVLNHELAHKQTGGFTKEDFVLDVSESNVSQLKLLRFMIRHPKALIQLLPIYIKNKNIVYDLNMLIVWGVSILAISSIVYFTI